MRKQRAVTTVTLMFIISNARTLGIDALGPPGNPTPQMKETMRQVRGLWKLFLLEEASPTLAAKLRSISRMEDPAVELPEEDDSVELLPEGYLWNQARMTAKPKFWASSTSSLACFIEFLKAEYIDKTHLQAIKN